MLFGKAGTQMPVGWGGRIQTRVTRKPSEAETPLGLALGSVVAGERPDAVMACAFPQCLLRPAACQKGLGTASDQGFPESHTFYGKASGDRCILGSWF